MRRGRIFFYLAFILLLGLVAAVVVFMRLRPGSNPSVSASGEEITPPPAVVTVDVVVVSQPVTRGATLNEEVLTVVPTQENLFMPGMYSTMGEVVGRQVKYDVQPNTPVLNSMLIEPGQQLSQDGSVAAINIPRGMVAVAIPIKDEIVSVAYGPRAGDHVNIIATVSFVDLDPDFQSILPNNTGVVVAPGPAGETGPTNLTASISGPQGRAEIDPVLGQTVYVIPSERQRQRFVSQTLIQDAVVLQVGEFLLPGEQSQTAQAAPEGEAPPEEGGEQETSELPNPEVITLIVSPQDALTLNYLLNTGAKLSLALRSSGDDSRVQTEAVTLQFLLDQYRIPIPVKLPYGFEHNQQTEAPPVP